MYRACTLDTAEVPWDTSPEKRYLFCRKNRAHFWCAIKIAHQLLWQNMEAPVSVFQESPLAGEPRQRLFHIHSVNRYQLHIKYLYPSTLL